MEVRKSRGNNTSADETLILDRKESNLPRLQIAIYGNSMEKLDSGDPNFFRDASALENSSKFLSYEKQ